MVVTVRDEGFIGRSEAAYGNAEIWGKVPGWLDACLRSKKRIKKRRQYFNRKKVKDKK